MKMTNNGWWALFNAAIPAVRLVMFAEFDWISIINVAACVYFAYQWHKEQNNSLT